MLTPDDVTIVRQEETQSPRDNVLLELGMFLGALGRSRTFIVYDRTANLKLPSDLAGVTPATYQPHTDENLQAALGAATTLIKGMIEKEGQRRPKLTADVDYSTTFQIIHDLLDSGMEQFVIWMHETNSSLIRVSDPYVFGIKYEYALRNGGGGWGGFSIDKMCGLLPDAGLLSMDLRQNVSLTDRGKDFAQWLVDNGHKAIFFESAIGQWGERPEGFGRP